MILAAAVIVPIRKEGQPLVPSFKVDEAGPVRMVFLGNKAPPARSTFPSPDARQVGIGEWSLPGFWKYRRQLPLPSGFMDPERWG